MKSPLILRREPPPSSGMLKKGSPLMIRSAFSLIELIVTFGILLILAALSLPVGLRMVESSRATQCLSNLRQIGVAAATYSGDNDGRLVPLCENSTASADTARAWRVLLIPYMGDTGSRMRVFSCPSDPVERKRRDFAWASKTGLLPASYGINMMYYYGINGQTIPFPGLHSYNEYPTDFKITSIKNPASTIFLSDIGRPDSVNVPIKTWTENTRTLQAANFGYAKNPSNWKGGDWAMYPRHAGAKTHVLFYDGHATSLDLQKELAAHPYGTPACLYDNF